MQRMNNSARCTLQPHSLPQSCMCRTCETVWQTVPAAQVVEEMGPLCLVEEQQLPEAPRESPPPPPARRGPAGRAHPWGADARRRSRTAARSPRRGSSAPHHVAQWHRFRRGLHGLRAHEQDQGGQGGGPRCEGRSSFTPDAATQGVFWAWSLRG